MFKILAGYQYYFYSSLFYMGTMIWHHHRSMVICGDLIWSWCEYMWYTRQSNWTMIWTWRWGMLEELGTSVGTCWKPWQRQHVVVIFRHIDGLSSRAGSYEFLRFSILQKQQETYVPWSSGIYVQKQEIVINPLISRTTGLRMEIITMEMI